MYSLSKFKESKRQTKGSLQKQLQKSNSRNTNGKWEKALQPSRKTLLLFSMCRSKSDKGGNYCSINHLGAT